MQQDDEDLTSFTDAMAQATSKMGENFVDGTCHRQWCQDMDECLWVTLRDFQNNMNERFFEGSLSPEEFFVSDDDFIRYTTEGCNLPEEFYESATIENRSISFILELLQALDFVNNFEDDFESLKDKYEDFNDFGQNIYRFLQYSLLGKDLEKRAESLESMRAFIQENDLFDEEDKNDFLLVMSRL